MYEQYLSDKVKQIKPSGIRKYFDMASEMEGVISLGVGEPDFTTLGIFAKLQFIQLNKVKPFIQLIKV